MRSLIFFIGILSFGFLNAVPATAQNYQQLLQEILEKQKNAQSQIDQLNALIDQYQNRLSETEQEYEEIYHQYENQQRLVALQEKKIESLQEERRQINAEIAVTKRKLNQQQEKLDKLIENYKETMRYVYKHGRTSQLALILSSGSVNQMMVRNYYLKEFEQYREKQAREIKETQKELEKSRKQLDNAAEKNENVLAEIEQEKVTLEKKEQRQRANVKLLQQDREQLKEKIATTQQQKANLNSTTDQLIAQEEEIRQEIKRQEEERKENLAEAQNIEDETEREREVAKYEEPVRRTGFIADAELADIEQDFSSQKGVLPWPVESKTVSEHFGRRRHPVYGTVTPNLGIEIVTKASDPVKVVHDGYVFAVQPIAGYGDVVFVSHGKYKTAYGNLSRVLVRKNTILQKGDIVGYSGDQNSTRGESVFFMLREGSQNLDPESWLE